jgi:superfamily II DNA or RNA helicase
LRTYGTLQYDFETDGWLIRCEPQVSMKLKRVFGKIGDNSHGTHRLTNTPENARELEWFAERYPLELDDDARLILTAYADEHREREQQIARLIGGYEPPLPFELALPPREYQQVAATLCFNTGRLLLADDVGLGKTVSFICMLARPETRPAVVVTLAHLPRQWEREIGRFAPGLKTHIVKKGTPYHIKETPDVFLINYHKLAGWAETLGELARTVCFDECLRWDTNVALWGGGTRRITALKPGDEICSFDQDGWLVPDVVREVVCKGLRPVYRLTLVNGRVLECTDNEKLFTDRGWVYLREIINEAGIEDESEPFDAAGGHAQAVGAWELAGGFVHKLGWRGTRPGSMSPRQQAGSLLSLQGGTPEGLRAHPSQDRAEFGLRRELLLLQHGDVAGLRIHQDSLLHAGGGPFGQECQRRMARRGRVARDRGLVHGRRHVDEELRSHVLHPLVLRAGGALAGRVAGPEGGRDSEGRPGSEAGPLILGSAIESPRDGLSDRRGAAVYSLEHDLQDRHPGSRLTPSQVIRVEFVGFDEVWDVETATHHTLLANGIAVHNCQELRHSGSGKYSGAFHLASKTLYRMGLSATPIYNYGGEFFNVLQVLAPGALGDYGEFMREWCTFQMKPLIKEPRAFGGYLRETGLMLRRTRADVARELPPLSKFHQFVESDLAALDQVGEACAELARLILRQGEAYRGEKMRAAEELSNTLRQATGIAKAPFVAAFVRMLVESGEKVVLYGWHREVYSIWLDRFRQAEIKAVMYTGSESPTQKEKAKQEFVEGDAQVMVISLRAGAGLDGLQHVCKTVVFGELDWSPGVHEQCVGRVYRDGQPLPVMAYFLVSEEGSDPVIAEVLGIKRMQIEGVRQTEEALVEKLEVDPGHIRRLAEAYLERRR